MALTTCAECNSDISDQAAACPHCGAPVTARARSSVKTAKAKRSPITLLRVLALLALALVGGALVSLHLSGAAKVGDVTAEVKEVVAAEIGVKTERVEKVEERDRLVKALNARVAECNSANDALTRAAQKFEQVVSSRGSPGKANLEDALRTNLEAVRVAKAAYASFRSFVDGNGPELSAHGVDSTASSSQFVIAFAALDAIEQELSAARVREHSLDARREWDSAGIDAKTGDYITIWASGTWKAGPDWKPCGPDGTDETSSFGDYRIFKGNSKLMALLGRVSSQEAEGTGYVVGSHGMWAAPSNGTIQFRCNDSGAYNNDGSVSILVLVMPPRPR